MMNIAIITGISGALLIMVAFLLIQLHKLSPDDWGYDMLNVVGSLLLLVNAVLTRAWPFVVLNMIWALSSLYDVIFKDRAPWDTLKKRHVRRAG